MNNGELSKQYSESALDGIVEIAPAGDVVSTEVFSVNGVRQSSVVKGLNIVRRTYANGAVKTTKVLVK